MNEEQVKEIFSDEAFTSSLLALETPEEVQSALRVKGLDLSLDEIETIRSSVLTAVEQGGELSEASLETVTGGMIGTLIFAIVMSALAGAGLIGGGAFLVIRSRW